jgi:hypothetical protein
MAVPSGRLTRGRIIQLAQREAGNTNSQLIAEMRVWLNLLLQDLYSQWDWTFLFTSTTVSIGSTSFPLPDNFLKTQDEWGLKVTMHGGVITNLRVPEVDREHFDAVAIAQTTGSVPLMWHPDRQAGVGLVWPTPDTAVTATLRYKVWIADADVNDETAYDADIPTFPFHSYLVEKLRARVYGWDRNIPMADRTEAMAEAMFARQRGTALPRYSIAEQALDPSTFGPAFIPEDT